MKTVKLEEIEVLRRENEKLSLKVQMMQAVMVRVAASSPDFELKLAEAVEDLEAEIKAAGGG